MPLVLQPLVEADMERAMEIQDRAFSTELWDQIMFPNGINATVKAIMVGRARKDFHNPNTVFMKVVDTDHDNEMIAFARWYIYRQERPESEWNKPRERRDFGPDANNEALNEFMGILDEKRMKHMAGEPHCLLGLLDTHPDHQRRGAGGMLVQWGTDIADEAGLPCYLEATSAGHHLYDRKGFKDVVSLPSFLLHIAVKLTNLLKEIIEMNMAKYGKEEVSRHICMIRPAKTE
ncbi:hypothetical protein MMC17_000953 [Xylographa soralifera]|nr:hypothetical protein [Xylographa soralifera]